MDEAPVRIVVVSKIKEILPSVWASSFSTGNLTTLADDRKDLRDFLAEALDLKKE